MRSTEAKAAQAKEKPHVENSTGGLRVELLFQRAQGRRGKEILAAETKRAESELEMDEGRF